MFKQQYVELEAALVTPDSVAGLWLIPLTPVEEDWVQIPIKSQVITGDNNSWQSDFW